MRAEQLPVSTKTRKEKQTRSRSKEHKQEVKSYPERAAVVYQVAVNIIHNVRVAAELHDADLVDDDVLLDLRLDDHLLDSDACPLGTQELSIMKRDRPRGTKDGANHIARRRGKDFEESET
jgi:hypothetical protein